MRVTAGLGMKKKKSEKKKDIWTIYCSQYTESGCVLSDSRSF